MEPEWFTETGLYDFPGTLFPCNPTSCLLDLMVFGVPDLPQEPHFCLFCSTPPKKRTKSICLLTCVSFRVLGRGGITHMLAYFCHRSRVECKFLHFTLVKQLLFEDFSVPALTLGPQGP